MPKRKKKFKQDPATLTQSFSKNLLGLKFMQRAQKTHEKDPAELNDDEDGDIDTSIQLDTSQIDKLKTKRKCIINPSYQSCEGLRFGRLSFKGMNLDVEAIMYTNSELERQRNESADESSRGGKRPAEEEWDEEDD